MTIRRLARQFTTFASFLARAGAVVSVGVLFAITALTIIEILARLVFSSSTFILDEFGGYAMATMTFLTLAHAMRKGALIRITILIGVVKGWARRSLEYFAILCTMAVTGLLIQHFCFVVSRNWERGAVSGSMLETPLWIPGSVVLTGLLIFALCLFAQLLDLIFNEDSAL